MGNIYVSNYVGNYLERFTPAGAASQFVVTGSISGPAGLAFDAAGNLYVANSATNAIEKVTPACVGSVFVSSGLSYPAAIAITNDAGIPLSLPVPEPADLALAILSGCVLLARRKR